VLRSAKVKNIARRLQATPAQVAIAWLLAKSSVMLPIPGTASIAHLEENMRAAGLRLSAEDVRALS
jgi:aryl-alcohol dehydrogenase-like predicted oxidoreductase